MNRLAKEQELKGGGVGEKLDTTTVTPVAPVAPVPSTLPPLSTPAPITITSEAQFAEALQKAPGAVLVDFSSKDCGYCDEEAPRLQKIAAECATVTVLKVDVDQLPALADRFNVDGTPTLMYAKTGAGMTPDDAEELADARAARKRLKCARVKR